MYSLSGNRLMVRTMVEYSRLLVVYVLSITDHVKWTRIILFYDDRQIARYTIVLLHTQSQYYPPFSLKRRAILPKLRFTALTSEKIWNSPDVARYNPTTGREVLSLLQISARLNP